MSQSVRVRFAPSPTGCLHIGGARTALYNWAFARRFGGTFILRIDDTDPERSTEENTQIILRALRWLGLDWDEGPQVGGAYGPYFQTQRADTYLAARDQLAASGSAYPCFATADEIEAMRVRARNGEVEMRMCSRLSRDLDPAEAQRRIDAGEPHVWRLKVPDDRGVIIFNDAVHGRSVVDSKELDDFVILRSDGTPTYNFATVVDDALMQISHVIRGDDHLSNTPRQVLVYEALGYPLPEFAHLSMILGADGKRLSKRHGAASVEEYQEQGYLPQALINFLALLGWSLDGETTIINTEELCSHFDLSRISKNPAVFNHEKLVWMNGEYIKNLDVDDFVNQVLSPSLTQAGLLTESQPLSDDLLKAMHPLVFERVKLIGEAAEKVAFLLEHEPIKLDEKSVAKNLKKAGALEALEAAKQALMTIDEQDFCAPSIDAALEPIPDLLDAKKRLVFQAIRVAICGNQVSPPLAQSMEILGKQRCLTRLNDAMAACA